ncbi:CU044_2847 family protein [Rhizobium leguminosarum]|uniref:Trypsin-co-occurring domain-containing protein n=2 Tax=Rhizobium leguminosarum TaxID=384 RepID=A0A154IEL1_RHILE|nr:CU044_2847 family protein [Rhizobium leguminosarum]KZA98537.1 hypothetical protein A4A59_27035 [Rhizobium leguminosarum]
MTGIVTFTTPHGTVAFEVDDAVARKNTSAEQNDRLVAKGFAPPDAGEIVASSTKSFGEAMSTFKAYVANLQDLLSDLVIAPSEVSVELGLKLTGSAGFVIAKAGAESEIKISLSWKNDKAEKQE